MNYIAYSGRLDVEVCFDLMFPRILRLAGFVDYMPFIATIVHIPCIRTLSDPYGAVPAELITTAGLPGRRRSAFSSFGIAKTYLKDAEVGPDAPPKGLLDLTSDKVVGLLLCNQEDG